MNNVFRDIPIYWINLETSLDRRENMEKYGRPHSVISLIFRHEQMGRGETTKHPIVEQN